MGGAVISNVGRRYGGQLAGVTKAKGGNQRYWRVLLKVAHSARSSLAEATANQSDRSGQRLEAVYICQDSCSEFHLGEVAVH